MIQSHPGNAPDHQSFVRSRILSMEDRSHTSFRQYKLQVKQDAVQAPSTTVQPALLVRVDIAQKQ